MNKLEMVRNEVLDEVEKVLKKHGFEGDDLNGMMGMVNYGLFCEDNPECGLLDYFEV